MIEDKRALRARMRAARDAFVAGGPAAIGAAPGFVGRLAPGLTVASYVPIGSEASPAAFERAARDAGCRLALPFVVDRATPIRFVRWDGHSLEAGPFNLRQPRGNAPEATPDIIIAPLLAFDASLNRLGQGAGHYDRAFASLPAAWRMGLAWSVQRVEALAADPWDVPLHAIATERDWIVR